MMVLQLVKSILALAQDVKQQVDLAGRLAEDGAQNKNAPPLACRRAEIPMN